MKWPQWRVSARSGTNGARRADLPDAWRGRPGKSCASEGKFAKPINRFRVLRKFRFTEMQIRVFSRHPAPARGAYGQSSPNARRDAVDADVLDETNGTSRVRRSRVVPAPRRWRQACR